MQELRKQAISVEHRVSNRLSATTLADASKTLPASDTDSSSNSSTKSSSSGETAKSQETSIMPRHNQLQQTPTFIYDSTQQQQQQQQPQQRPQTLSIGSNHMLLPTICVNPPTPLQPPPLPAPCPTVESICNRKLTSARRKLNKITNRIMHFEQNEFGGLIPEQGPIELLWQNETLFTPLAEKRAMQRSSTSPALHAGHEQGQQMQRSRSFTLEQPSQALVDHMQRVANENETTATTMVTTPPPPPLPPLPAEAAQAPLEAKTTSPRCHFNTSCSSPKSLSNLRRDTVESKAKQVQRVTRSASTTMTTSRRSGGHTPGRLQQQQQQIKELLQRALHETTDVIEEQDVEKRRQLAVAKQKMLKDIKSAHRDRFQQLVQYQLEEQRRMQAEFDRQQKLLIEQICADINVSTYAMEQSLSADGEILTNGKSEYTSTDDLPSLSTKSETQSEEDLLLHANDSAASTARKRLFEDADRRRVRESHEALQDLSLESLPSSSSSPKSRVRKPVQRNVSKPTSKLAPPPVTSRLSRPQTPASNSTSTGKRSPTKSRVSSSPAKSGKQQPNVLNRQRQSVSPSRQTVS